MLFENKACPKIGRKLLETFGIAELNKLFMLQVPGSFLPKLSGLGQEQRISSDSLLLFPFRS